MTKAHILERKSTISISEVRIHNRTDKDYIIIEDGCAHCELNIYSTDDVKKLNDRWIEILKERDEEDGRG